MTALEGIRVLDLTRLLPGPFCTMLLADLGADVIKVEEPNGGDPARHYVSGEGDTGSVFLLVNRNKRSLTLDLKKAEGRDLLLRLVEGADVLVESFRPGVMDRLGVGYAVLSERNPRLIYATLSGFGQAGPYRDRAGHDLNYLSLAGVLGYNVDRQGQPVPSAVQVADLGAASFAAVGILAAVIARQHTGRGQSLDVSLFGSAIAWLPTLIGPLFNTGRAAPPGEPMLAGGLPQYEVYSTADGRFVTLGAIEPKFFVNFLERVGRLDLARHADREHVRAELRAIFCQRTLQEWVDYLAEVDTCFAPVNTLQETLDDPQVRALDLLTTVEHARLGSLKQLAPPFALSDTPATVRRPPPDLGQHTAEILQEAGLTTDEISALIEKNVV